MIELEVLKEDIKNCTRCSLYKNMPLGPILSVGNKSNMMIVGEAPGEREGVLEEPFVGLAGKTLDKILEKCGLQRDNFYICNTVNCRPMDGNKNRKPTKEEIKTCSSWLYEQIKLVQPKLIFTLGITPTQFLLEKKGVLKLEDYIGQVHTVNQLNIMPNYHPSYLMQHGRKKTEQAENVFKKGVEWLTTQQS